MINPDDEIVIDDRTSITKDELVAKLLGWMRGARRLQTIQVTDSGIPAEQLPHLPALDGPLLELLEARLNAAKKGWSEATDKPAVDADRKLTSLGG